jgi:two-component system, NarL family, response regulator NreC
MKALKARVAIVENHTMMRMGLSAFLKVISGVEIVIEADSAKVALAALPDANIDVMVIDLQLPDASGVELVSQVRRLYPNIRLLMISAVEEVASIAMAKKIGAHGLVSKRRMVDDIGIAMKEIVEARNFWPDIHISDDDDNVLTSMQPLSPRELEVLRLIGDGKMSKDIARDLQVSVRTIDVHRANIKRKLRVKSTSELVKYAVMLMAFSDDDRREGE